MSLRINHNIASINGHRNMMRNDMAISSSLEKLSSGLRINKAADDAAGLVISEQMRAQITGINQAIDNSETAISMVQTAEGALDEVNSLLNKARELVLHAANEGANDTNQLAADQAELDNVLKSIDRIGNFTQFGTKKLLDGSLNGVASKDSGINRVNVGNLANNSAVNTGAFSLAVTGIQFETVQLSGGGTVDTGSYLFTSGTGVTGVDAIGTGATVNSGVTMSVTIDGTTYSATSTGAATTVSSLVSSINADIASGGAAYTVAQKAGGGLTIARTDVSTTDIVSGSVSFTRASGADTGNVATSTATLSVSTGADTVANVATALFSATTFSGVTTGTTFTNSGVAQVSVQTSSGGAYVANNLAISGGETVESILNQVLSGIHGAGIGLSGASLSVTATASGLSFTLTAATGDSAATSKIDFSLALDNTNSLTQTNEVVFAEFGGQMGSGEVSTIFGVNTGGAITQSTTIVTGTAFSVTVEGKAFTYVASAGTTVEDVASGLSNLVNADTSLAGDYKIAFITGGSDYASTGIVSQISGLGINTGVASAAGLLATGAAFAIARTDNAGDVSLDFTLSIDSVALSGSDYSLTGAALQDGAAADASFNLETVSQSATSGVAITAGSSAVTLTSSGSSIVTSGTAGVTATLTSTANPSLTLTLSSTGSNVTPTLSGGATLTLTDAANNEGFKDVQIEIDSGATSASSSTLGFSMNNGAKFQVGANANQTVGVTIAAVNSMEIGRNAEDAGTLSSLNDLLSTEKSALTTGLTTEALNVIDKAIDEVTNIRGGLGAFQANTLESGLNSLRVSQENLTAAESTIRDVDFAAESAKFTRNNIMIQASTAMLAQANQLPQNVLQLLG